MNRSLQYIPHEEKHLVHHYNVQNTSRSLQSRLQKTIIITASVNQYSKYIVLYSVQCTWSDHYYNAYCTLHGSLLTSICTIWVHTVFDPYNMRTLHKSIIICNILHTVHVCSNRVGRFVIFWKFQHYSQKYLKGLGLPFFSSVRIFLAKTVLASSPGISNFKLFSFICPTVCTIVHDAKFGPLYCNLHICK